MIGSLKDLQRRDMNLAVIGILGAIVDALEEYINCLGDINWFIHATLVCFKIGSCDLAILIDEMIE